MRLSARLIFVACVLLVSARPTQPSSEASVFDWAKRKACFLIYLYCINGCDSTTRDNDACLRECGSSYYECVR